jgi:hypothetical protein
LGYFFHGKIYVLNVKEIALGYNILGDFFKNTRLVTLIAGGPKYFESELFSHSVVANQIPS